MFALNMASCHDCAKSEEPESTGTLTSEDRSKLAGKGNELVRELAGSLGYNSRRQLKMGGRWQQSGFANKLPYR